MNEANFPKGNNVMRHLWACGAAAVSILAGAAVAQAPAAPAPAARAPAARAPAARPATTAAALTTDERQRLVAAGQRGILLFELARAAQLTTRDMLSRLADPTAAGVVGWVATQ